MGTHSRPIDGTVTANGHQLVPLVMAPLEQRGAVSVLPQQQPAPPRWWRDGDTVIRVLAAAVVLAVAAFAAIVSYSHIFELGSHHGQDGTAARLLPLSVDGLIAAASLVMLHAARRKLPVPQLARWMLGLGVAATVAANVEYGMPFGWLAAVVSAWPAIAFVGSVEMAVRFVRDARADMTDDDEVRPGRLGKNGGDRTGLAGSSEGNVAAVAAPVVTPRHDKGDRLDHAPGEDRTQDRPARGRKPHRAQGRGQLRVHSPAMTKQARAAAVIRDNPGLTNAALAKLADCDVRTISRARNGKT